MIVGICDLLKGITTDTTAGTLSNKRLSSVGICDLLKGITTNIAFNLLDFNLSMLEFVTC